MSYCHAFMAHCLMILGFIFSFSIPQAHAVQSVNVQTFNPSTSDHFVLIEDGLRTEWPKASKFNFGANYNYVKDPLVATDLNRVSQVSSVIDSIQSFDFFIGFKPDKQLGLFIALPIHSVSYAPGNPLLVTGSKTVAGDAKLMAKVRLNREDENTAFSLIPEIHLPTGNSENFVSDASTYLALRAAVERVFEKFTLGLNLGFAVAPNATYATIDFRKRMILGIGGFLPITEQLGFNVEFNSQLPIPFNNYLNPNEAYLGLRFAATDAFILTGGISLGKLAGATGQNIRAIAGLRFNLYEEKEAAPYRSYTPPVIQPTPTPAPPAPQKVAAAPSPTPVIPVLATSSPAKPAPAKPAVVVAPVITKSKHAVLKGKQIELSIPVNFENGSDYLTLEAKGILDEVADIIKSNSGSFKTIHIDGHTDNIGDSKSNMKLSLNRAKSVKAFLVKKGIPAKKLVARGFGSKKPKVAYTNPNAHEINRRVEFTLIN